MSRWAVAGALALAAAGLPGGAGESVNQALKAKGWFTAYEAARAEARRTGKPLFVVFRCQP